MDSTKAGRRVSVLFYLLTIYILFQFIWWAYLLINLNLELHEKADPGLANLKIWMVIGEGSVFLIILLSVVFIMQRTIRKEISLVRQQRNFLLSITHELRTPLAAIQLCLETLSKHPDLNSDQRGLLQKNASENTDRLRILIDNVLLATRIDSGEERIHKTETNISELTQKISDRMAHTIGADGIIHTKVREGISGLIDPHNFETILVNLIENAHKYGGDNPIQVSLQKENAQVLLKISDLGPGIPTEFKERIFDKFYRLENEETRSKKGTGLGLYIVKELIGLNRGTIRVESNKPQGSSFSVMLPLD